MSLSVSSLLRVSAIGLTAGLVLVGCSSDDDNAQTPTNGDESALEMPEAPAATEQETALAETLEADFEVTEAMTTEEQWPDIYAVASALSGTQEPDLCQQAGADQYGLLLEAQPASVRATIDPEAHLDEHASGETVTVYYANDEVTTQELHEAHEQTDTACVEEDESTIQHDVAAAEAAGRSVEKHTWEIVTTEHLTGRMIDIVSDEIFVRYAAAYPPQVAAEDLEDDAAEQFNEAATQRAVEIFEVAAAQ